MSDPHHIFKHQDIERFIRHVFDGEVVLCPRCGATLFTAAPRSTTKADIQAFAVSSPRYSQNKDALAGWIHPGIYWPQDCFEISIEFGRA